MVEFERKRASSALNFPPGSSEIVAFRHGRNGTTPYFPDTPEKTMAFRLGLDFRFKRLGVDDIISAEVVFQNESFAHGFLTRFSINPKGTGEMQKKLHEVYRERLLEEGKDAATYIEGSLAALKILHVMSLKEEPILKIPEEILDGDDDYNPSMELAMEMDVLYRLRTKKE